MNFNREVQQIMKILVLKSFGYIVYDLMYFQNLHNYEKTENWLNVNIH